MLSLLASGVILVTRDRVQSVVGVNFGQRLIEFNEEGYGVGCVWYQTIDAGSYAAWIGFGSGRWVVGLDERIVDFVDMWARAVCD